MTCRQWPECESVAEWFSTLWRGWWSMNEQRLVGGAVCVQTWTSVGWCRARASTAAASTLSARTGVCATPATKWTARSGRASASTSTSVPAASCRCASSSAATRPARSCARVRSATRWPVTVGRASTWTSVTARWPACTPAVSTRVSTHEAATCVPVRTATGWTPTSAPARVRAQTAAMKLHCEHAPTPSAQGWRRGVVVSGVRRMNEVNARRARLVSGWVTVFGRV